MIFAHLSELIILRNSMVQMIIVDLPRIQRAPLDKKEERKERKKEKTAYVRPVTCKLVLYCNLRTFKESH